ncbi:MAG: cytochrome P450 [Myxococcota bacterium]
MQIAYAAREFMARRVAASRKRTSHLPPGPAAPSFAQLGAFLYEPLTFMRALTKRYGDIFTLRLPGLFTLVQVHKPEHVRQMFRTPSDVAHAGEANGILEPFLGPNSLLVLDEGRHLRQRKLMLPPFRGDRMKAYGDAMVRITDRHLDDVNPGRVFTLQTMTQSITLDVIMETVFGVSAEQEERLRSMLQRTLRVIDEPAYVATFMQKDLGPLSPWGRFLRLRDDLRKEIFRLIATRRKDELDERTDILSMLLLARDEGGEPMSDMEVHDELVTLLIAGHETTATALSWTFHRLCMHEDVLQRVLRDVDSDAHGYLDAVIRESLRIHPVVPGVGRALQSPIELAGYEIPAGIIIGCSILLAHEHPGAWPEPRRFNPERFVDQRPPANAYFPFGGGIRRCIGEAFALYEMRCVMSTVLRRFVPRPSGHAIYPVRRNITISPCARMPIVFETRQAN